MNDKTDAQHPARQLLEPQLPIVMIVDDLKLPLMTGWATTIGAEKHHTIFVVIDGINQGPLSCSIPRDDLAGTRFPPDCGFSCELSDYWLDGKPHTLEFRTPARRDVPIRFIHEGRQKTSLVIDGIVKPIVHGMVDDISGAAITGWVLRETKQGKHGDQTVLVTADDEPLGQVRANRYRPDVLAAAHKDCDAFCGFRFVVPMHQRRATRQTFRFYLLPERVELDGSPFVVQLLRDAQERKLVQLGETVERLEREIEQARSLIDSLQPRLMFAIEDYTDWATGYHRLLRNKKFPLTDTPLVSIICPTYRPDFNFLMDAIDSVRAQTYENWELLVVDDGNHEEALDELLAEYVALESRIRVIRNESNGGISAATASGLAEARGEWGGFLDHDDVLNYRAIEIMISEAQRTAAEMLYSDEDKLDFNGELTGVHLKGDFNYRLLLTNNYICHFLMVKRARLRLSYFDSMFDGAQDHHLVLALSETIPPDQIHHVSEILYHWRITPNSTAQTVENKPGVALAGIAALRAHLRRRGVKGEVIQHPGWKDYGAFYLQRWRTEASPKVSIIVPFRDNADMTRQCLEAIRKTDYPNFNVILVDNWSTEASALRLVAEAKKRDNVSVLRVREPFNFSRLNNLACEESGAAYFLFMNNDVVQQQPDWLRRMVDEALVDCKVAAVGAKLLYPNGFVQHAGVILGIAGVADHAHHGLPAKASGYGGRAFVPHEVSAVTAACMLVDAAAFRAVGGYDENLAVIYNDVDLCLKIRAAGHKIVFTPDVVAIHHESFSRGRDNDFLKRRRAETETRIIKARWKHVLPRDPYYSRFFSLDHEAFSFLKEPSMLESAPPKPLVKQANVSSDLAVRLSDLMAGFSSLGCNCEFGIVQRVYGYESLELLRSASTSLPSLIAMLRDDFAQIGHPNVVIYENGKFVRNDAYQFASHTGQVASEHNPESLILKRVARRLPRLAENLREQLREGEKTFVRWETGAYDADELNQLALLLRERGTCNLLFIEANPSRIGEAEHIGENMFRGFIKQFADPTDVPGTTLHSDWLNLCLRYADLIN